MTRDHFLRRIAELAGSESEPAEFVGDTGDDSWHVVSDVHETWRLESACALEFVAEEAHPGARGLRFGPCTDSNKRWEHREQTHFLQVTGPVPMMVRDHGNLWIAPAVFDGLSTRAFRVLTLESSERRVHVFALPNETWEFVPEDDAPVLAFELDLDERGFRALQ